MLRRLWFLKKPAQCMRNRTYPPQELHYGAGWSQAALFTFQEALAYWYGELDDRVGSLVTTNTQIHYNVHNSGDASLVYNRKAEGGLQLGRGTSPSIVMRGSALGWDT